ncbi:hypothetical protein [Sinorhizobium sp. M4_45]|uniref:hypothetical protein n=1 Tax=Sinorhizobium sp. M4_45 TaxID=2037901 RepID=UPI000CC6E8AE|nr:hypothetical protein [Sinorhizobium sp. M4_45]PND26783.1 hypothetical protein CN933_13635 [Sinorhizobium sp. M4_45]
MRYLVTPSFSEKVTRSSPRVLAAVGVALKAVETATRDQLVASTEPLLESDVGIYVLKGSEFQILLSFGTDAEGEYALLVDLIVQGGGPLRPLPSRDPNQNMMIDPRRNVMIDPNRNMMIDPNRNMMIDPRRNMMIDPRRNMMIDPRRNMMIDPNRNMMIDPRRNYLIDPKRNWLIDPRRNTVWDGPYLFDLRGAVSGFLVRASDKVAILFDEHANFIGPVVPAGDNYNVFDKAGIWTGFLVPNGVEGFNRFDVSGRWSGFVVGDILPKIATT